MADLVNISFEAGDDTGDNDPSSITPLQAAELALPETFNRPTEKLRVRTERLRSDLNKALWLQRFGRWTLRSTSQVTPTEVVWPGPYDGVDPLLGLFTLSDDVILEGIIGPGESRGGTDELGGAPYPSRGAFGSLVFGADTLLLNAVGGEEDGANWLTIEVEVGTTVLAAPTIVVSGTSPAAEDAGFVPDASHILVTLSSDATHTTQDVIDALTADVTASALVTASLVLGAGTEVATAVARTDFNPGLNAVRMTLSPAVVAAFFATATGNLLRDGDTLGVYLSSVVTLLSKRTEGTVALLATELVNTTRYPHYAQQVIPLCRAFGNDLHFVNGVVVTATSAPFLEFVIDPSHAQALRTPDNSLDTITVDAPTVRGQLYQLAQNFDALYQGTSTGFFQLGINTPAGPSERLHIYDETTLDATILFQQGNTTPASSQRYGTIEFSSLETAAPGKVAEVRVARAGAAGVGRLDFYLAPSDAPAAPARLLSLVDREVGVSNGLATLSYDKVTNPTHGELNFHQDSTAPAPGDALGRISFFDTWDNGERQVALDVVRNAAGDGQDLVWWNQPSAGTDVVDTATNERMRLTADGRLGIGYYGAASMATAPHLQVFGVSKASSGTTDSLALVRDAPFLTADAMAIRQTALIPDANGDFQIASAFKTTMENRTAGNETSRFDLLLFAGATTWTALTLRSANGSAESTAAHAAAGDDWDNTFSAFTPLERHVLQGRKPSGAGEDEGVASVVYNSLVSATEGDRRTSFILGGYTTAGAAFEQAAFRADNPAGLADGNDRTSQVTLFVNDDTSNYAFDGASFNFNAAGKFSATTVDATTLQGTSVSATNVDATNEMTANWVSARNTAKALAVIQMAATSVTAHPNTDGIVKALNIDSVQRIQKGYVEVQFGPALPLSGNATIVATISDTLGTLATIRAVQTTATTATVRAVHLTGGDANLWNVAISNPGNTADVHTVTILGTAVDYVVQPGDVVTDVVNNLIANIQAAALPVWLTDNGPDFDILASTEGLPLGVTYGGTGVATGVATESTPETVGTLQAYDCLFTLAVYHPNYP